MKDIIDMSRHRGYFIDQSQSLNLFMEGATMAKLTSMHFYAWKSGFKTGMYYLRTKSAVDAIKFTLDNAKARVPVEGETAESEVKVDVVTAKTSALAAGGNTQNNPATSVESLTPEELKQMLEQSKKSEDDDCLMCGS